MTMTRTDVADELGVKTQGTTVWVDHRGRAVAVVARRDLNPAWSDGRISFGAKATTREQAAKLHGRILEVYVHETPDDYEHVGTFQISVDASPGGVRQAVLDAGHTDRDDAGMYGTVRLEPIDDADES